MVSRGYQRKYFKNVLALTDSAGIGPCLSNETTSLSAIDTGFVACRFLGAVQRRANSRTLDNSPGAVAPSDVNIILLIALRRC